MWKDMRGKSNPEQLPLWCRQQWDIYSQRQGHGVAFHLETHKLTRSSKQQLPQPGVCGPVCHTSFPPSLHVCWQANDSEQTFHICTPEVTCFTFPFTLRSAPHQSDIMEIWLSHGKSSVSSVVETSFGLLQQILTTAQQFMTIILDLDGPLASKLLSAMFYNVVPANNLYQISWVLQLRWC